MSTAEEMEHTDSHIPAAVIEAAQAADAQLDALEQQQTGVAPDPTQVPDMSQGELIITGDEIAPAAPPVRDLGDLVGGAPAPVAPTPAPVQTPAPANDAALTDEIAALKADNATLTQQYKTLQGKLYAEVPRQQQQISELKDLVKGQQQTIETLTQAQATPTMHPALAALSAEERADYGSAEDALGVAGRAAVNVAAAARKQDRMDMEARLEKLQQEQDENLRLQKEHQLQRDTDTFWRDVDAQSPGASTISGTESFEEFLMTPDPLTGMPYAERGKLAMQHRNPAAIAKLIDVYKEKAGLSDTPAEPAIKPDTVATAPVVPDQTVAPIITRAEIRKFEKDCTTGVYGANPEVHPKVQEIMAVIDSAAMEGRIQG